MIDAVVLALLGDSYPGHEFSWLLCDSTLEVLSRRARTGGQHMRHSGQRSVALSRVADDNAACALASGNCDLFPGHLA